MEARTRLPGPRAMCLPSPGVDSSRTDEHGEEPMNWPTAVVVIAALFALAAVLSSYFAAKK
ncbi:MULTISPECIES: hypothetical protein [Streptomyces]|uniref:hypothetical protein n=1 Tax=Streptomyces TaxID=1883 RepID=UPI000A45F126|nr:MULTISPECIES: hypothetical protein [Streptomyces]